MTNPFLILCSATSALTAHSQQNGNKSSLRYRVLLLLLLLLI